jgi:hypothetical protein
MRFRDAPGGLGRGAWLACTGDGAVLELSLIRREEYAVLAAVEAALGRDSATRLPCRVEHSALRSAIGASAGGSRALAEQLAGGGAGWPRRASVWRRLLAGMISRKTYYMMPVV